MQGNETYTMKEKVSKMGKKAVEVKLCFPVHILIYELCIHVRVYMYVVIM